MIEFIFICSLAIYGLHVAMQPGMIFHRLHSFLGYIFELKYGNIPFFRVIRKPLYSCPMCMPSIWGSLAYWITYYGQSHNMLNFLFFWPICILAMSGIIYALIFQFPLDD
jgi:hypothetical protein